MTGRLGAESARLLLLAAIGGSLLVALAGPLDELQRDGTSALLALKVATTYVLVFAAAAGGSKVRVKVRP